LDQRSVDFSAIKASIVSNYEKLYDDEYDDTYDMDDGTVGVHEAAAEDDEEVKDPVALASPILMGVYASNPSVFDRQARKSTAREALKQQTQLSDEQIEGWRVLFERNVRRQFWYDLFILRSQRRKKCSSPVNLPLIAIASRYRVVKRCRQGAIKVDGVVVVLADEVAVAVEQVSVVKAVTTARWLGVWVIFKVDCHMKAIAKVLQLTNEISSWLYFCIQMKAYSAF
jgi:hypothetical protein